MKKNELMNGDIVVLNSGSVAVVIGEGQNAYLLYQYGGFEFLDECYDEELYNEMDEDMVMQVFRSNGGFGLEGVDQEVPIWERDEAWECPTEKEREEQHRTAVERHEAEFEASLERIAEARKDMVYIVAQGFYGNRTGTEIYREEIDRFILHSGEPVDRTMVHLPGSDNLVLIYNARQEEKWRQYKKVAWEKDRYVIKPLATIPELNLKIYSRCIVCRINSDGEFESLGEADFKIWDRYLAN